LARFKTSVSEQKPGSISEIDEILKAKTKKNFGYVKNLQERLGLLKFRNFVVVVGLFC